MSTQKVTNTNVYYLEPSPSASLGKESTVSSLLGGKIQELKLKIKVFFILIGLQACSRVVRLTPEHMGVCQLEELPHKAGETNIASGECSLSS